MIGSFTDIIITPVMTMLLGGLASIGTIILFKYYGDSYILTSFAQPSLRILFGALSGIFAAIAVAARINDTTVLANNMSQVAGLELVGIAITIGVGCIVGSLSAVIIMFTAGPNSTEVNRDAAWWDIQ